jgi:oligopeptidase A
MSENPLLNIDGLPKFSRILPEHVEPAIDQIIAENQQIMEKLLAENTSYDWENLIEPLDLAQDRLQQAWSPVRHMNSVVNTPELREVYNACLPKLSAYYTDIGQNAKLYKAYQSIRDSKAFSGFEQAQKKSIDDALRGFRLSGVSLNVEKKARFKEIQQQLSALQSSFEENVLDATNAWTKHFNSAEELSGLPESALEMASQAAKQRELDGWLITLEFPSYYSVITYADDRALRQCVYEAYVTRASEIGPGAGQWDNSENMLDILAFRQESAELLGFANYAEESIETKMAESPESVMQFLSDLSDKSKTFAQSELEQLRVFAREQLNMPSLEPWDIAYASEKLRQDKYQLSEEELKPYFPVDHVTQGLFDLCTRLFGIQITEVKGIDTWHPDVRFYEIRDRAGILRGQFYFDLYARQHKRGGAWMDECINRLRKAEGIQTPVAYLTCNSTPPVGDKPALFTHDEVITLFHEFGHGLQHMLTQVEYPDVSGISGIEWDAVELPSQFMENWCWEKEALDLFARHYETNEPMQETLYKRLQSTRHFQAAMQMLRQVEFALFDIRIHADPQAVSDKGIQGVLDQVRQEVAVLIPPEWNRFQHGFSHIFAGGYAAGYYSYKWAEVLSADAFARFEEEGLFNPMVGTEFLQTVLEMGGSQKAMDVYKAFRGREPTIDALLRHNGLAA